MSTSLLERMAELRQRQADIDPCPRSELATTSSPLSLYLAIYSKANHECYINYMEGAKLLLNWLAPAGTPLDYQVELYPAIEDTSYKVPRLMRGYETGEICSLLEPYEKYNNTELYFAAQAKVGRAIYLTLKNME